MNPQLALIHTRMGNLTVFGVDLGKLSYLGSEVFGAECYGLPLTASQRLNVVDPVAVIGAIRPDVEVVGIASIDDTPLIIDGGANVGVATAFFRQRHPDARIIAIEPNPEAFLALRRNIAAWGGDRVIAVRAALGREGVDATTLYTSDSPASLRTSIWEHRANWTRSLRAPTFSLARLIRGIGRVALLKLDVEGAEYGVLVELGENSLLERVDALAIEYHYYPAHDDGALERLLALLSESGFALERVDQPLQDGYKDVLLRGSRVR